jgi:hypothetical protein
MRILLFLASLVFSLGLNAKTLVSESVATNNELSFDLPVYDYQFIGDVDIETLIGFSYCEVFLSDTVPQGICGTDMYLTAFYLNEINSVNDVGKRTQTLKSLNSAAETGHFYRRSRDGLIRI